MVREVLQAGLEVEMVEHLGYEAYDSAGRGSGNSRNGTYAKTVKTDVGPVDLRVPRDREGTFEPLTVPKHVRRLEGFGANVISLYAKGLTTGEIQAHLAEIYDTQISRETISKITDEILDDMVAWQSRPLDRVYPVLLIDALVIKVRDSQVANRPVYVAIGVNMDGERDVLGLWLGPAGGEGAKQWMSMLSELKNRGIADALIVCCDGLKGLPEAIKVTWPDATVQTLCRASRAKQSALRFKAPLGAGHARSEGDLHRPDGEGRRDTLRGVLEGMEAALPCDDRQLGARVGGFHPVLGVSPRVAQDRLHHERDRVAQRALPQGCAPPRALPKRPSRTESSLPRRDSQTHQPREPHRTHQRLEAHPQHPNHPLRRQTRHQLKPNQVTTTIYTNDLTDPQSPSELAGWFSTFGGSIGRGALSAGGWGSFGQNACGQGIWQAGLGWTPNVGFPVPASFYGGPSYSFVYESY